MSTHPFNKGKLEFKLLFLKNRINSIPRPILLLSITAFISIILIEVWLINVPAPFSIFHQLGNIYLKLCYSFFSAFIFYFLIVHIPKEKRKLKALRLIGNKVSIINNHVFNIMNAIFFRKLDPKNIYEIKAGAITEACKKINPQAQVEAINYDSAAYELISHNNWFYFFNNSALSIKNEIKDILILNDSVDTGLLEALTHLDDSMRSIIYKTNLNRTSLEFASLKLIEIKNDSYTLFKAFYKAYGKFLIEYHTNAIKKNRQLIEQGNL